MPTASDCTCLCALGFGHFQALPLEGLLLATGVCTGLGLEVLLPVVGFLLEVAALLALDEAATELFFTSSAAGAAEEFATALSELEASGSIGGTLI